MTVTIAPPMSVFGDEPDGWTRWAAGIAMKDKLFGGVPANPKTIDGWLRSSAGVKEEEERRQMMLRTLRERGYEPETTSMEALEEASRLMAEKLNTNGFKRDPERGLYIEGRQVMAMLRESVSVLYTGLRWKRSNGAKSKTTGEDSAKAATSLFRESVHVPDERIYLGRDEADGVELKIVHPKDPTRESSLTYVEYVERATLSFTVEELEGTVPPGAWKRIWQHAERNGLGAMRSQQHGKFAVARWEAI